jgi:hypothetical protein
MELLSNFLEVFDREFDDFCLLSTQYRGWNFGALTTDPYERWLLRPPLLTHGGSWKMDVILGKTGYEYNLNPFFDVYDLTRSEADLLKFIHLYEEMNVNSLEKQLNRSRKAILSDWKNLLRQRIIFRFPIFSQMGLGSWIYFQITNLDQDCLRLVLQHFKFLPFCNIYFSDSKKGITLIGFVNIPLTWTHTFLYRFASLSYEFPKTEVRYYVGPDIIARWSMDISKTFDWKSYEQ